MHQHVKQLLVGPTEPLQFRPQLLDLVIFRGQHLSHVLILGSLIELLV